MLFSLTKFGFSASIVTEFKAALGKADGLNAFNPLPTLTCFNLVWPKNALSPISSNESGRVTTVKLVSVSPA